MKKNREMIEFLFDFSGLEFMPIDLKRRDNLVAKGIFDMDFEEAVFAIKADKVEYLLNKLRTIAEES